MNVKKFKDECPFCGSEELDFGTIEPDDEGVVQDVTCLSCGRGFTIFSELHWEMDIDEYHIVE